MEDKYVRQLARFVRVVDFSDANATEVTGTDAGWTIGEGKELDNPDAQDAHDSESLYSLLETKIAPTYYKRDATGLPTDWIKLMKASMATVVPRFSTARMVRDYAEAAYLPAAKRAGVVSTQAEQTW